MAPAAEPLTAEQALQNYRDTFSAVRPPGCPPVTADGEIVVCGRRPNPIRLPLPIEREPGEVVRHAGEPSGATGPCRMCTRPVGVDLNMMKTFVKGIGRLLEGDD